jgi:AcrR family transcriptional regulator
MARARVTREQWLELGLERFGQHGLAGLKVEAMAAELGSSKAGFYWYFDDRDSYVRELFAHWHEQETTLFIREASQAAEPRARLERLFHLLAKNRVYRDVLYQLRLLAQRRKELRELLEQIERERVGFAAELFAGMGFAPAEARGLADFLYSYYLGWHERQRGRPVTRAGMARQFRLVSRLLGLPGGKK